MVSNQVKAYDRVFVAGEAAVRRHRAALSEFNEQVLVRVGRPQLDQSHASALSDSSLQTLLYAPTWAGEDEANNYTSMEYLAPLIIDAMLKQPNARVVYKPHPRIADSANESIRKNHEYILRAIKKANSKSGEPVHVIQETGDILATFPKVDLLISDVSSIALDFLYLNTDKPIILTDRRDNLTQLKIDSPLSTATQVLTKENINDAERLIAQALSDDGFFDDRIALREFYFDNVQAGESAPRFFAAMRQAITQHSQDMIRANKLAESGTGPSH
jgi:CDP-glycerol glycerophosphotransferase (TagB/SpsB family)